MTMPSFNSPRMAQSVASNLAQALERAVALHRQGDLAQAEKIYVEVGVICPELNSIDAEAPRRFAALPCFPHGYIGRLDVASEAVGVEQGMRQPVRGKSISI